MAFTEVKIMEMPFVSIVTVNYKSSPFLPGFFESLNGMNYPADKREIIMVDNSPGDGAAEIARGYPEVKVISSPVNNYCAANNRGIAAARGEFIAIVNNDTLFDAEWLVCLVKALSERKDAAAAGSLILLRDGRIQSASHAQFPYFYWGDRGFLQEDVGQFREIEEVKSISNCAALYRKQALEQAGLFDEDFSMYMEDVDMAYQLGNKGWRILFVPDSVIRHTPHGSVVDEKQRLFYAERNRLIFIAKNFPQKLPEFLVGFGEMTRMPVRQKHQIYGDIIKKLLKHHSPETVLPVWEKLQENIVLLEEYQAHCALGERELALQGLQEELSRARELAERLQKDNEAWLAKSNVVSQFKERIDSFDRLAQSFSQELSTMAEKGAAQAQDTRDELRMLRESLGSVVLNFGEQGVWLKNAIKELFRNLESQTTAGNELKNELSGKIERLAAMQSDLERQKTAGEELKRALEGKIERLAAMQSDLERQKTAGEELKRALAGKTDLLAAEESKCLALEGKLKTQFSTLEAVRQELAGKNGLIAEREAKLAQKENELKSLYDSTSYRLFVRPILWPAFSAVKSCGALCSSVIRSLNPAERTPVQTGVVISLLKADQATAYFGKENRYTIRLFNDGFREETISLVFDIWPYHNRCHPDRHYAFFSVKVKIGAKSVRQVVLDYDWDKKADFSIEGEALPILDSWSGTMKSEELFLISAYFLLENKQVVNRRNIILQKLAV